MSYIAEAKISCKNCGKESAVKVYQSINDSLNPELTDKLVNGELTDFKCSCGEQIKLRYPILFNPMSFFDNTMIRFSTLSCNKEDKSSSTEMNLINEILGNVSIEEYFDWNKFISRVVEVRKK